MTSTSGSGPRPAHGLEVRGYLLTLRKADDPAVACRVAQLSEAVSPLSVWTGIDGRRFSAPEYYRHLIRAHNQHGHVVSPAEVGCSLSHVAIIDDFLLSSAGLAAIFEDDVIVRSDSTRVLTEALAAVGTNDILVACHQGGLEYLGTARGRPLSANGFCFEILRDDWTIVKRTCSYVLGRQAAEHLRRVQNEGIWPPDDFRVLCPPDGRLLYCNAFEHPRDERDSVLAPERALKGGNRSMPMPLVRRLGVEVMRSLGPRIARVSRDVRSRLNGYRPI